MTLDAVDSTWRQAQVGGSPAHHQRVVWQALASGRSVVLRSPTGSGKTEAVTLPFLSGQLDCQRLTYVLPMRALADGIGGRLSRYAALLSGLRVGVHHGEAATVRDLSPDLLVTTLDQAVCAYAATPLSSPVRWGHVVGGHVATSILVFDEVHLYDPDLGLQAALVMAEGSRALGMPVVFATATLPTRAAEELQRLHDAVVVEGKELADNRSVIVRRREEELGPDHVLQAARQAAEGHRVLVFCNTVEKAQRLYLAARDRVPTGVQAYLVHSRFTPSDRKAREAELTRAFGKEATGGAICVTTPAAEAGMDISADRVLTELCPADSLVQRAGRCVRWGGHGQLDVFTGRPERTHGPYDEGRCRKTSGHLPERLGWPEALALVDAVYGDLTLLRRESLARVCVLIDEGSYSASRHRVHEAVRDMHRVEVSVWDGDDPGQALALPRVPVPVSVAGRRNGLVRRWASGRFVEVARSRIRAGDWLLFRSHQAGYDPELGLRLDGPGEAMRPAQEVSATELPAEGPHYEDVLWASHCRALLEQLLADVAWKELCRLGAAVGADATMARWAAAALALHDIGKLADAWQQAIGYPEAPLSHFASRPAGVRPPHATVSAAVLSGLLEPLGPLGVVLRYVVAHHHQARAAECPPYELISGWAHWVAAGLSPLGVGFANEVIEAIRRSGTHRGGPRLLARILPVTRRPALWASYLGLSRLLVETDRRSLQRG